MTGIVKNNWNKDMPGKIQVEYRLGEEGSCLTGWLPVMTGYAGAGFGSFLLPETGSEVIVAFLHGSFDRPFVAGCLIGQVNTLPEGAAAEKNNNKLLSTKAGWKLHLDEEAKTLTFTDDKAENSISLASKDGKLSIDVKKALELKIEGKTFLTLEKGKLTAAADWEISAQKLTVKAEKGMELGGSKITITPDKEVEIKGKSVELSPSQGVTIKGQKTEIKPSGEVSVAGSKVSIKPSQALELKSVQTKVEGVTMELKGSASLKAEAGGMMEVKGAMVKLN